MIFLIFYDFWSNIQKSLKKVCLEYNMQELL